MPNANLYLDQQGESDEEREARLLALLESAMGTAPAVSPHGALTSPAQAGSPVPVTDRQYTAPPEPTAENSGITDLQDFENTPLPPPQPKPTIAMRPSAPAVTGELGVVPVTDRGIPLTPTAGPSLDGDPRALALSINPLEELERVRSMPLPDHTTAASRVFAEGGERPNFMGLEDEFGFKRDQRIQQARDLYAQANVPNEARWEEEYLRGRKQYTDADLLRGQIINQFIGGQDAGLKWRQMATGERDAFNKGLYEARDRDLANQRVSPALAEAIAGSGMATPEAAVRLRMNDPIVKAFTSGGYSQGLRAEEMERRMARQYNELLSRTQQGDLNRQANRENTVLRGVLGIQAALANRGIEADPEKIRGLLGSMFASSLGVEPDVGARVADGDLSGLSPEQTRTAQIMRPIFEKTISDEKSLRPVITAIAKEETTRESKKQTAVDIAVARAANDPKFRVKMETDLETQRLALKNAFKAWQNMSDAGKQAFVQFAPTGIPAKVGEFVKHLGMEDAQKVTENDRVAATALRSLFQDIIQKRAGVAVSESEWGRTAAELGLANGSWDPFNSPRAVGDVLNRLGERLKAHRDVYQRNILDWGKR